MELIDLLYRLGETEEAKKWISVAEKEGVIPAQAAFFKGLALLKEGEDLEELLVVWLNELTSMFFAYKFLPAQYNIKITHDEPQYKVLEGTLMGEQFSPYENKISREIKAATYHNLKVKKVDKNWQAEIIFDV